MGQSPAAGEAQGAGRGEGEVTKLGFGGSELRLKNAGTAWQRKWHVVPRNAQAIEIHGKLHVAANRA